MATPARNLVGTRVRARAIAARWTRPYHSPWPEHGEPVTRGVLTIETGLRCNNHCAFCPQRALRGVAGPRAELDTAEVLRRIEQGRRDGHDEVAFTGGEPTIRPDLSYLIAAARRVGFPRVSVSTNGRMFAYREQARHLIEAGLTGASVSLHGPDAVTHDELCGTPGAFEQAVRGIVNLRSAAVEMGRELSLNTVTLIVPQNADRLRETLVLAGRLGVSLHIVQPFIVSRETLAIAGRYLMALPDLVATLERAARGKLPHAGRVKPYNIPPCVVAHLGDVIEPQTYRLRTVREYEDPEGRRRPSGRQFYRGPECEGCRYLCPGFRAEHRPVGESVALILDSVAEVRTRRDGGGVTLACLDLLDRDGIARVLAGTATPGAGPTRVLWGGYGRARTEDLLASCRDHGVAEVCLVAVAERVRPSDRRAVLPGNLDRLEEDLSLFHNGAAPVPSLLVPVTDVLDDDCDFGSDRAIGLADHLVRTGGRDVFFVVADFPTPYDEPYDEAFRQRVLREGAVLASALGERGLHVRLLRSLGGAGGTLERSLAGRLPTERWDASLARHPFVMEDHGWVMWSRPSWLLKEAVEDRVGGKTDDGVEFPSEVTRWTE